METLPPRVEHRQEPDGSAETFGIRRNRQQRFRCRAEKNRIDFARILQSQPADLFRQRKYHVEVWNGQQLRLPVSQPVGAGHGLTLWAMPVAARVVRDGKVPARIALLHRFHVTAESGRTAIANGFESFPLTRTEYVSPFGKKVFFVRAEDIGHFEPMLFHS